MYRAEKSQKAPRVELSQNGDWQGRWLLYVHGLKHQCLEGPWEWCSITSPDLKCSGCGDQLEEVYYNKMLLTSLR